MASEQPGFASFEQLVRRNGRIVFLIALSVVGNAADAEEVAQDAFLRAYLKFDRLEDPQRFRAWVCRIAQRVALNRIRSEGRFRKREENRIDERSTGGDVAAAVEDREFQQRLAEAIDRLPARLREVVQLCAIDELEPAAVAAILGIPAGTVRSRLHAGRKQLMRMMS